ncbi:MAG: HAD-IB family hydrolase [Burkholderiaceae bacterium]|nr:HAD-IB family hydrolase [Burkholderiaceae bacterium]
MRLTIFDLDHTLLDGDSDTLWCEFLVERGLLDRAHFFAGNADMERRYALGTVGVDEFAAFYVSTLAGRTVPEVDSLRRDFLRESIVPRIPDAARALVARHLATDDLVVLSTATNRVITELTAAHLEIPHLIATEVERRAERYSGRPIGVPNMRDGKVERLDAFLAARSLSLEQCESRFYSDSINDLPLLSAVRTAVVVNPDDRLADVAACRGWEAIRLHARN